MMKKAVFTLMTAVAVLGACSDSAGPGSSSVAIKFGTPGSTAGASSAALFSAAGGAAPQDLTISGPNGSLEISEIHVIVEEFELEPVEVPGCNDDLGGTDDDCPKFEQRYLFINVPLDGTVETVAQGEIPPDDYKELEFEIDDVEIDADDPEEVADADLINALFAKVRETFPDWPEKASMVVIGTFTPTGGTAVEFTTYFEAEIEVELEFPTPLHITGEASDPDVVVQLHPELWFRNPDDTVWNLAELQDQLVEFEIEFENGFELEIED